MMITISLKASPASFKLSVITLSYTILYTNPMAKENKHDLTRFTGAFDLFSVSGENVNASVDCDVG